MRTFLLNTTPSNIALFCFTFGYICKLSKRAVKSLCYHNQTSSKISENTLTSMPFASRYSIQSLSFNASPSASKM